MRHVLITGGAGFVGSHVTDQLLADGWRVTVVDNFDAFYDPAAKRENIQAHLNMSAFELVEGDIRDIDSLRARLRGKYDAIIHLAAKAGVLPSIRNPIEYQEVNVRGTQNLLELAREWSVEQFVFASSSSVYGVNPKVPWREDDTGLLPISPYAVTKVCGELLGHCYSHLHGIRFIGLRLFTVYGPRQRPDLAIHKLAQLILEGEPLPVYGDGSSMRDYTYVGDIVRGICGALEYTNSSYELFNLGNQRRISVMEMVRTLEQVLGVKAKLHFQPVQAGDVPQTCADINKAAAWLGYAPSTDFETGVRSFFSWLNKSAAYDPGLIGRAPKGHASKSN